MDNQDIIDFKWYPKDGQSWVPENTIFLTKHGSQAYGTNLPDSDLDIRGVCIPPKSLVLSPWGNFENSVGKYGLVDSDVQEPQPKGVQVNHDIDYQVFSLAKFVKLAADNNPNVLELLFADPTDWYIPRSPYQMKAGPAWTNIWDHRRDFLSKKVVHTFSGYAHAQLKRMQTHRRWLLNPPTKEPTRTSFGLPDRPLVPKEQSQAATAIIQKQLDGLGGLGYDQPAQEKAFMFAGEALGLDSNFLELLKREREYNNSRKYWVQFLQWKKNRNPARAKLEAVSGYDTKHAMHLVRLYRMCAECLVTGYLEVKRPDAEELKTIRAGAWTYDQLIEWAEKQQEVVHHLADNVSTLPKKPNHNKLEKLYVDTVEEFWR